MSIYKNLISRKKSLEKCPLEYLGYTSLEIINEGFYYIENRLHPGFKCFSCGVFKCAPWKNNESSPHNFHIYSQCDFF